MQINEVISGEYKGRIIEINTNKSFRPTYQEYVKTIQFN